MQQARRYCGLPACPFPICWRAWRSPPHKEHSQQAIGAERKIMLKPLRGVVCLSSDTLWRVCLLHRRCPLESLHQGDSLKWHLLAVQNHPLMGRVAQSHRADTTRCLPAHIPRTSCLSLSPKVLAVLVSHWEPWGYFSQLVSRLLTMRLK